MARPKRSTATVDLLAAIKATAMQQIAEHGAPALSLRAIARELKITAPAIYNYYPSRDELVTALIIDAFTSFGDSQLAAREAIAVDDFQGQLVAIGLAYRQWALAHPQHYQLIFGTPLPGYVPPVEQIRPAGVRSLYALVGVIQCIQRAGRLWAEDFPQLQPEFAPVFRAWYQPDPNQDLLPISVAMLIWGRVHGLVSLEIIGSLPPFGAHGDALYRYELQLIGTQFIKEAV